ncbi:MAG TPA: hypothetical protein VF458_10820 [Ktedonobacteraceae bacterium]
MKEQVEEYLANLLSARFKGEKLSEMGYEYAVALQVESEDQTVIAPMMARAAQLVKDALPGAYRIYELRNRMR